MNNKPIDTTPGIDKDYEVNMGKKVNAMNAKIQGIWEQNQEDDKQGQEAREPRKRITSSVKVEIPEPNTKKLKSNNKEESNEFGDFESYQKASEKAKKGNSYQAAKRIVGEEFESRQKQEQETFKELLFKQFAEYREKEKEYREKEEKLKDEIEEIKRELEIAREELVKETELLNQEAPVETKPIETPIEKSEQEHIEPPNENIENTEVIDENREAEAPANITILEKTEEVETSLNTEMLPKEKEEEVIPVTDTQKEVSEIIKTENGQEITVLKEPLQIKIEEVINENVSVEEKSEIQKAFPDQNIWDVIKNQVTEEMNDKTITPTEEKKKIGKLKMVGKKITKYLLAVFVTANSFQATTFFRTGGDKEILSYNNTKVENLKDWENIKLHEDEINKLENLSIITKAHENSNDKYLIVDKENGKAHRYQGDNLIKTYNVCLGDSIGDEQTKLKSIYRKVSEEPDINAGGEKVFHRRSEVSLDEATYVENGERYMRPGYEAFTEWGEGNMQTGAGIYTISNKGPFLDDFGIFLKNERGMQVATSLHVNSHLEEYAPDFRFTNGCVGFSKENLMELYRTTSSGENIYILPDNPHNKFQIVDGELRFLSNQQNVNRTIRPYESKPLILKAENINETGKVILITIAENKEKLMSLYPTVSNDVYNELAKIAYGIFGQESTFGTYGKARGQYGRIKDFEASAFFYKPSVGACQVRLENLEQKVRDAFNIKKNDDLFDTKKNAVAAMSILLDNYLYAVYNGKMDQYQKLAILRYNAPKEAKKIIKGGKTIDQLGPRAKSYIKKVLSYSEHAKVYTTNTDKNFFASNWNYNAPNN